MSISVSTPTLSQPPELRELLQMLPLPELLTMRRILCIQPHPDDMEVAAGGTIARLVQAGALVAYVTVTDGGLGSVNPRDDRETIRLRRRREQEAAAQILGVQELRWLDFPDGGPYTEDEVRVKLLAEIRRFRPEAVITVDPWLPYEGHPDHRKTGMAAVAAALLAAFPRAGEEAQAAEAGAATPGERPAGVRAVILAATAYPNAFVDVTATWETKMQAIRAHASQFPDASWPFYEGYFRAKAAQYGKGIGAERAEAFKVLTPTHLHMNPDARWM
ncbi:PIG-L deacetylase family protein [Limnochorda sp.]|uniref:PIG-L deacetylase family protein n=1 Tax=Limnochorda sp. TaxID=1940279 RepID=UPI0017C4A3F8|nr:PIG-L family deacetylase [Bacillota bacterium]